MPNNDIISKFGGSVYSGKTTKTEAQIKVEIAKRKVAQADKPFTGTVFYLLYTLMKALSYVFVSYLY